MAGSIKALLQWEDPRTSGIACLALNLVCFLLNFGDYTVVSLGASVLLVFSVLVYVYHAFHHDERVETNEYEFVTRETVEEWVLCGHQAVSWVMGPKKSFQEFMLAVIAVYFGAYCLSCSVIMWIIVIGAFTLPLVYATQKATIEPLMEQAKAQVTQVKEMVIQSIPKSSKVKKDS